MSKILPVKKIEDVVKKGLKEYAKIISTVYTEQNTSFSEGYL
jgi:hypothetical protein